MVLELQRVGHVEVDIVKLLKYQMNTVCAIIKRCKETKEVVRAAH